MSSLLSSKSKLIQINSADRNRVSDTRTNFTVDLGSDFKVSNVKSIAFKDIQFINSFYNVDTYNNQLFFHTGAGEVSITLAIGQYTLSQLIAATITAFAALGAPIVLTLIQDPITKKLDWTTDVAVRYYEYKLSDGALNPAANVFGIIGDSGATALTYLSAGLPDIGGVKVVNIISPELAANSCVSSRGAGRNINLAHSVPMISEFGVLIAHESSDFETDGHRYDENSTNNLNSVHIELRDENNNLLNSNGNDIVMTFKVYY